MGNKIRLKNIQLYGTHGVTDAEKKDGQQFEIDIEITSSINRLKNSDDIDKTIDYRDLYESVRSIFFEKEYNLIESLANKIATSITKKFNVSTCKIVIRKPDAPIDGILEAVEVEVQSNV